MSCSSCGRPLDEECKCSTDIAIEEADPGHTLPYFSEQGPDYSATKSRKHAMLALNVGSVSQVRNFALSAAILVTLYFLLQSFHVGPQQIENTTRQSIQAISNFAPDSWRSHVPRITKVSSLAGHENELYEAAIQSHEQHNRIHGYDFKVLRETIVDKYYGKTTYLLSVLVDELAKPAEERTEWLVWMSPDIVILNPEIPLEIFLPPEDFSNTHFLASHDQAGFNSGIFFLRVHEWSVNLLIDVLAMPPYQMEVMQAEDKTRQIFHIVLEHEKWRESVLYQPRLWYNAYLLSDHKFEGQPGSVLVHFHNLGGDRWTAMSQTFDELSQQQSTWSKPLEKTGYTGDISDYWQRMRKSRDLQYRAQARMREDSISQAVRRLQYASTYEADDAGKMNSALDGVEDALGIT